MEETIALMNQLITENATAVHNPDEYYQRYQHQEQKHQAISNQITDLTKRRAQAAIVRDYLATQLSLEYSDEAWNVLINYVIVCTGKDVVVLLHKNGGRSSAKTYRQAK